MILLPSIIPIWELPAMVQREYLYELKHMEEFETAVIPIGDGVTISTRIR